VDGRFVPHITQALRGRLFVESPSTKDSGGSFIDRFPGLRQDCEELVIFGAYNNRLVAAGEAEPLSVSL
jgi:hypothetical protein